MPSHLRIQFDSNIIVQREDVFNLTYHLFTRIVPFSKGENMAFHFRSGVEISDTSDTLISTIHWQLWGVWPDATWYGVRKWFDLERVTESQAFEDANLALGKPLVFEIDLPLGAEGLLEVIHAELTVLPKRAFITYRRMNAILDLYLPMDEAILVALAGPFVGGTGHAELIPQQRDDAPTAADILELRERLCQ